MFCETNDYWVVLFSVKMLRVLDILLTVSAGGWLNKDKIKPEQMRAIFSRGWKSEM